MRNIYSLIACFIIAMVLLMHRVSYPSPEKGLKVTDWDALGYYMYLPAIFIYNDITELKWFPGIDRKYAVSGGSFYQAGIQDNGKYVFKYLGGVAILQAPCFLVGHWVAKATGYPQDGFSPPYQYAIAFGALIYCILSLFLLRKILLTSFKDKTAALTLVLLCLATNLVQYVAIDGGMSHAWIFPLYVFVLYTTQQWHERPRLISAALTGLIIGLATISRPTEAIMLFIPLFWDTHTRTAAREKWHKVKENKMHVVCAILFGFIGILPQLIYWKVATGSFIYDVGSKWTFLNPFFRVLFGWEKGWIIYTPVTIFFVAGLFFVKQFPFRKSVLFFCLADIYIIISWYDWRYGGSYSTRALVQSYPVFALPFAAFIEWTQTKKWRVASYILGAYFIGVNIFQVWQYNKTILHYDHMNKRYYGSIYLDTDPTPLDMSLLDTDETLKNDHKYQKQQLVQTDSIISLQFAANTQGVLLQTPVMNIGKKEQWLKIETMIQTDKGLWESYLNAELHQSGDSVKHSRIRLFNAISKEGTANQYAFYMKAPEYFQQGMLRLYITSPGDFEGRVLSLAITKLER